MEKTSQSVAALRATEAIIANAMRAYRMAGFRKPFGNQPAARFNHLFDPGHHLSICQTMAVVRPERLRPALLGEVNCVTCLAALAERMREGQ